MIYREEKRKIYEGIWCHIKALYYRGFCVSERGLQAALYADLQRMLPDVDIVVEPTWMVDGKEKTPDLVIVERNEITDIFELEFVPHYYADFNEDIGKLLRYDANSAKGYNVSLNPTTGQWERNLPVSDSCLLHFVVVANLKSAAVWPESLEEEVPELKNNQGILNHWFGRTSGSDGEWGIEFGVPKRD